jgi:hypothetical protein
MTKAPHLDSLPVSEAPERPAPPAPVNLPDWRLCDAHGTFYLFECRLCKGPTLSYGL